MKVFSLKNNRIESVMNLLCLTNLENLYVLDVDDNYIPKEALDMLLFIVAQNNINIYILLEEA